MWQKRTKEYSFEKLVYQFSIVSFLQNYFAPDFEKLYIFQNFIIKYISLEIDECASEPCNNGGSCVDDGAEFSCACVAGFTGEQCETGVQ